jgi:hypothetical protein
MTCESSDGTCSVEECETVAQHRDGDRALDEIVRLSEEAGLYAEWDDQPTHEKWRRGQSWR